MAPTPTLIFLMFLLVDYYLEKLGNYEIKIVKYFNNLGKGRIDFLTKSISSIRLLFLFWFLLTGYVFLFYPEIREVFFFRIITVAVLHFLISEGFFKYLLPVFARIRKRPYIEYPDIIKPIGREFSDSSIPSSHITSTVAMLIVFISFFPILVWPSILFILSMAFARLHNGMHYPSDMIVGVILGTLYALIAVNIFIR